MPLVKFDQGTINYRSEGNGDPMIMLLPQSSGPRGTSTLLKLFSKQFLVILYDQLGTGDSRPGTPDYKMGIADRVNEAITVLDALNVRHAHFFCHSTGCGIGLAAANIFSDRVASLTLVNPWSYADESLTTMQRLRITAAKHLPPYDYAHFNFMILFPAAYRRLYQKQFEQMAEKAVSHPQNLIQIKRRLEAILAYDTRDITQTLSCRTLAITSTDDILMPNWHATEIVRNIPNSNLITLQYGGHMLPETRDKRVFSETHDFLKC